VTNAELAVLSLIAEGPQHGYAIEQLIEARGMREWTDVGFSSIYYLLKKLEKEGLVRGAIGPSERGLGRRVYHVTPQGVAAWQAACLDALAGDGRDWRAFLLGLAGVPALERAAVLDALHRRIAALVERERHMAARQAVQTAQAPLPDHVEALFDYSLTLAAAERRWVEAYLAHLEERHDSD
jgi:DNA-binding PadR family transcriptional regulator